MNKLKTFYKTFIKSLTQPSYYIEILTTKYSFSVKYLGFLLLIISLFSTFKFAVGILALKPKLPEFIDKVKKVVTDVYPDRLVITLKGGKISTNVREPFPIDMPPAGADWKIGKPHLITIDTKGKVENFSAYNAEALITSEFVVVADSQNGGNGFKAYPIKDILKDVPDGASLTKSIYISLVSNILPYIDKLPNFLNTFVIAAIILWPFLSTIFALSGHMFYLLFTTVLLWVISMIMKKNLTYWKIYQLSLHAITLPILLSLAMSLLGKNIPYLFFASFLVFMIVVLTKIPTQKNASS